MWERASAQRGKKAHGEIGTGNSHLTNDTSLRKFTGKTFNTLSSEKLDIIREEGFAGLKKPPSRQKNKKEETLSKPNSLPR